MVKDTRLNALSPVDGFRRWKYGELEFLLDPEHTSFIDRDMAEDDPSYKQLIPYVIFRWGPKIFTYQRMGGGEKRLAGKRSIGIGGHINLLDNDGNDVYRKGMNRELQEELIIRTSYKETDGGVLYDDTTAVGKVHLGIVHLLDCDSDDIRANESGIHDPRWMTLQEIEKDFEQFERWSQMCVEGLL